MTKGQTALASDKKRPSYLVDLRGSKKPKPISSGMSRRDVIALTEATNIQTVDANDLRDVHWEEKNMRSRLKEEGNGDSLNAQPLGTIPTLGEVSKDSKKKHQINWLAMDVRQREMQLLEKSTANKSNQRSKALKYGW